MQVVALTFQSKVCQVHQYCMDGLNVDSSFNTVVNIVFVQADREIYR